MISLLSIQVKSASHINHELDEFKTGITHLINGRLSPLLLQKSVLDSTLNDIQNILTSKYPGFYLSQTSTDIYSASNFLYARNGTKIYLTVKIPISHYKEPLTVYTVTSLPVPINSTDAHATQLLDMPECLILTSNQQFYTTISLTQLAMCKGNKIKHCSFNLALTPVTTESCILALYLNIKEKVKTLCDFRFVHNIIKSKIIELNPSSIILYQTPLLSMECGKEHKMLTGCDFCILKVPCQCSFTTNSFYFAPRLTLCHNRSQDVTKLHPVNLALMQHFFGNSETEHIFADTIFKKPVNMSIPHFKFYNHDMNKLMADDKQSHLSLSKMADAAKRDAKIFQSLAEPLLDGEIAINSQWPDLNAILILITMTTTAASVVLLIWTFLKIKTLSAAVLALQLAKRVDALPSTLPSFIYKSQTITQNDEFNTFKFLDLIKWEHAIFTLLLLMFVFLIFLSYTTLKKRNRPAICLEITNTRRSVLIEIAQLPLCPSHCKVSNPGSVTDVNIVGHCLSPLLEVKWQNFTITNEMSNKQIDIPQNVKISLRKAKLYKDYNETAFLCFFAFKTL